MKTCKTCGTSLNENVSFCPNCGATVPESYPAQYPLVTKTPISVGGWIGRSLIPLIPLVGGIVYLIMLFVWSGDVKKEDTFRNWAKAQLIIMAVVIVLSIILGVLFGVVFSDMYNSF